MCTKGEKVGIAITDDDLFEVHTRGENNLVGRIRVENKFNKEAFKIVLARIRKVEGRVEFTEIQVNIRIFEFSDGTIKERVMAR
jgi:hypothetical protein